MNGCAEDSERDVLAARCALPRHHVAVRRYARCGRCSDGLKCVRVERTGLGMAGGQGDVAGVGTWGASVVEQHPTARCTLRVGPWVGRYKGTTRVHVIALQGGWDVGA